MTNLICILKNDNGTEMKVDAPITGGNWREAFNWLLKVYCKTSDVELFPYSIICRINGDIVAKWNEDFQDFFEIDE